jgi:hypothetical protein
VSIVSSFLRSESIIESSVSSASGGIPFGFPDMRRLARISVSDRPTLQLKLFSGQARKVTAPRWCARLSPVYKRIEIFRIWI